jgi:hypothetical protein
MNSICKFRKCTLTTSELIEKFDKLIDAIYDKKSDLDKLFARHIPARPNEDFDLLAGEILLRLEELDNIQAGYSLKYGAHITDETIVTVYTEGVKRDPIVLKPGEFLAILTRKN